MPLVTGNTYPVRSSLKALGGRWNPARQGWEVPESSYAQAQDLVASKPSRAAVPRRYRQDGRGVSNVARFSSGAVVYVNKGGRCEDAPCCGCCS